MENYMKSEYVPILEECIKTGNERGESYGSVVGNFREMARIHNSMFNGDILPSDMCKVLIATKVSREKFKHKKDNLVDLINYNAILLVLLEKGI